MPMPATNPVVVPATPEMSFDHWRLASFNILANEPNSAVRVAATLRKCNVAQDGTITDAPATPALRVVISDFNGYAATQAANGDASYMQMSAGLQAQIEKYAASLNVL